MSIFRALGDDRVIPTGTYSEFYTWYPYLQTNIYTMYRGLIIDYGMIGSVLFVFLSGVFIHRLFRRLLHTPKPAYRLAMFLFFIAFTLQGFGVSVLMWNSMPVSCVVLGFVLHFARIATEEPIALNPVTNITASES